MDKHWDSFPVLCPFSLLLVSTKTTTSLANWLVGCAWLPRGVFLPMGWFHVDICKRRQHWSLSCLRRTQNAAPASHPKSKLPSCVSQMLDDMAGTCQGLSPSRTLLARRRSSLLVSEKDKINLRSSINDRGLASSYLAWNSGTSMQSEWSNNWILLRIVLHS